MARVFTFLLMISYFFNGANSQNTYTSLTKEVNFLSPDGITIYADLAKKSKKKATILLFHQGGANARGEYESTLPTFYEMGYNVLAVDLRNGGSENYGNDNRTSSRLDPMPNYCEAQSDINSAIEYILNDGYKGKIILVGSSFSGSLAIRTAAELPSKVDAVLAFSPSSGGPMALCKPDEGLGKLNIPILILRSKREMAIESVQKQFELVEKYGHQTYVAENGTHGSSMLVEERVGADVTKNWDAVIRFLESI